MRANRSEMRILCLEKEKKNAIAYGIIGLGRFGEALATELARSGAELLVMDRDEERVPRDAGTDRKCTPLSILWTKKP